MYAYVQNMRFVVVCLFALLQAGTPTNFSEFYRRIESKIMSDSNSSINNGQRTSRHNRVNWDKSLAMAMLLKHVHFLRELSSDIMNLSRNRQHHDISALYKNINFILTRPFQPLKSTNGSIVYFFKR